MPIYEYECQSCGNKKDVIANIKDTGPVIICKCGAEMKRVISSSTTFILKGGGWYAEGYSKKN